MTAPCSACRGLSALPGSVFVCKHCANTGREPFARKQRPGADLPPLDWLPDPTPAPPAPPPATEPTELPAYEQYPIGRKADILRDGHRGFADTEKDDLA